MTLSHVTFTGWDRHTDLTELSGFLSQYPPRSIEVAVLFSQNRMGDDRYPEVLQAEMILRAAQVAHQRTAVHVCGPLARATLKLRRPPAGDTSRIIALAQRVQINIGEDVWPANGAKYSAVVDLAEALGKPIIVQARDPDAWPLANPGVEFLFDRSAGRGEVIDEFPLPPPGRYVGYAGGLGPGNVAEFMWRLFTPGADEHYWLDMETGIRERMDAYPGGPQVAADVPPPTMISIAKCEAVMRAVKPWLEGR